MKGKNKCYHLSKIGGTKFCQLLGLFAVDLTVTHAAPLCGFSVRPVNAVHQRIRIRLVRQCAAQSPFSGALEADESCLGSERIRDMGTIEQVLHTAIHSPAAKS